MSTLKKMFSGKKKKPVKVVKEKTSTKNENRSSWYMDDSESKKDEGTNKSSGGEGLVGKTAIVSEVFKKKIDEDERKTVRKDAKLVGKSSKTKKGGTLGKAAGVSYNSNVLDEMQQKVKTVQAYPKETSLERDVVTESKLLGKSGDTSENDKVDKLLTGLGEKEPKTETQIEGTSEQGFPVTTDSGHFEYQPYGANWDGEESKDTDSGKFYMGEHNFSETSKVNSVVDQEVLETVDDSLKGIALEENTNNEHSTASNRRSDQSQEAKNGKKQFKAKPKLQTGNKEASIDITDMAKDAIDTLNKDTVEGSDKEQDMLDLQEFLKDMEDVSLNPTVYDYTTRRAEHDMEDVSLNPSVYDYTERKAEHVYDEIGNVDRSFKEPFDLPGALVDDMIKGKLEDLRQKRKTLTKQTSTKIDEKPINFLDAQDRLREGIMKNSLKRDKKRQTGVRNPTDFPDEVMNPQNKFIDDSPINFKATRGKLKHKIPNVSAGNVTPIDKETKNLQTNKIKSLSVKDVVGMPLTKLLAVTKNQKIAMSENCVEPLHKRFVGLHRQVKRMLYTVRHYIIPAQVPDWHTTGQQFIKDHPDFQHKLEYSKYHADMLLNEKVALWRGNITELELDVIVNSTSSILLDERVGVNKHICDAAGPLLKYELKKIWQVAVGQVAMTAGYCLPATYIFHMSGPPGSWHDSTNQLSLCYRAALDRMKSMGLKTIAFPCIATGQKGIRKKTACHIALTTIREWLQVEENRDAVDKIILCVFDDVNWLAYTDLMPNVFPVQLVEDPVSACSLPVEILRMDKQSIELYKQTLTEGKEAVHNIRVMVVGHYGVGKTALTRRLLGKNVDIETRESTNGIEVHIRRCKVSLEDGKWTVLKKDEKSENTFKRLAKLMAQQELSRNSGDQSESSIADDITGSQGDLDDVDGYYNDTDDVIPKAEDNIKADEDSDTTQPKVADDTDSITDSVTALKLPVTPVVSDTEHDNHENTDTVEPIDEETIMEHLKEVIQEANNLKDVDSDYADLSVWDFAGQYAFYATHQVFLSARAIYLLVTDVSKHIQDVVIDDDCYFDSAGSKSCTISEFVEFWLNSIHGYCSSEEPGVPPVILVGTHGDKLDQDNKDELSEQYFEAMRNMLIDKVTHEHLADADFMINNAIIDPTLTQLRDKIYEVASQQQYWGELIPARWITLEKALMELKDKGLKICERKTLQKLNQALPVPLSSNEEIDLFLRFQHDSGNILYFSDLDLCDHILLDPQWLVDAFKCLITAKMFLKKKPVYKQWLEFNKIAKLKQELIDAVWKTEENMCFHDHRDHLLALLERLDIIARPRSFIEDKSQTKVEDYFFAPCVLKDPPPQEVLQPCTSTSAIGTAPIATSRLCFTMATTFIPVAMFNRLMASCLTQWPVSQQGKKDLIFCGCGVFDVDRLHRLTLFFSQNEIQIWVTKFAQKKPHPSEEVCMRVRKFIAGTLSRIQKQLRVTCEIKISIKCPHVHVRSEVGMFDLEDFLMEEEVACHCHDNTHVLMSADMLRYWNFEGACCEEESPDINLLSYHTLEREPTENELAKMSKRIGKEFQRLGAELGVRKAELEQIIDNNRSDMANQVWCMLLRWREMKSGTASYRELVTAMREVDVDVFSVLEGIR